MGKINGCIKCIFIFFNVVFMILGCVLIYGTVRVTAMSVQMSSFGMPGLGWAWVFAIGVLGVSSLGIYAACSEKALFLKIFAGFMGTGMIIMMIFGIIVAVQRNQIKTIFYSGSSEEVEPFMKEKSFRDGLEVIQQSLSCCGIVSVNDWGDDIPDSCACVSSNLGYGGYGGYGGFGSTKCKVKPLGARGPATVYAQSCGDFIFSALDMIFKIALGFCFGFAVTALMGLLITIFMIHQVKHNDTGGDIAMKGY
ncbi:katanin p80 WD40 repeat-containing subunit B1 [Sarotherodon galilaeus]